MKVQVEHIVEVRHASLLPIAHLLLHRARESHQPEDDFHPTEEGAADAGTNARQ